MTDCNRFLFLFWHLVIVFFFFFSFNSEIEGNENTTESSSEVPVLYRCYTNCIIKVYPITWIAIGDLTV